MLVAESPAATKIGILIAELRKKAREAGADQESHAKGDADQRE